MTAEKAAYARQSQEAGQLEQVGTDLRKAVQQLRPTALVGAAAKRGAFSSDVLSELSQVTMISNESSYAAAATVSLHWLLRS